MGPGSVKEKNLEKADHPGIANMDSIQYILGRSGMPALPLFLHPGQREGHPRGGGQDLDRTAQGLQSPDLGMDKTAINAVCLGWIEMGQHQDAHDSSFPPTHQARARANNDQWGA